MKKTMYLKKLLATTIAAAALVSMTAVAQEPTATPNNSESAVEQTQAQAAYLSRTNKITYIDQQESQIVVGEPQEANTVRFSLQEGIRIIDSADGSEKTMSDLKEGMEVSVFFPANSPMGMSQPPMSGAAELIVIGAQGTSVGAFSFDKELVDTQNRLQLNISEETKIVDLKGTKKVFTAEDIKGQEAVVIYGATTRSIPPQTNPAMVILLDAAQDSTSEKDPAIDPGMGVTPQQPQDGAILDGTAMDDMLIHSQVGLRAEAEKNGYTVTWVSNDKPVLLEKGNIKIELTLNSDICKVNGKEQKMDRKVELVDHSMMVTSAVFGYGK